FVGRGHGSRTSTRHGVAARERGGPVDVGGLASLASPGAMPAKRVPFRPGVPQAGGGSDARFLTPRAAVRNDSCVACPSAPSDSPCACFTMKRLFTRQRFLSGDSSNL